MPRYKAISGSNRHYDTQQIIIIAKCIVEKRCTNIAAAKEFNLSESTVRKYVVDLLPEINPELANKVKLIMQYNKAIRHLRGGEANKMRYKGVISK
jgi:putative DeoR family transcriptional regulator (stage III sporulation protein D)